jgi:hypothetical protein
METDVVLTLCVHRIRPTTAASSIRSAIELYSVLESSVPGHRPCVVFCVVQDKLRVPGSNAHVVSLVASEPSSWVVTVENADATRRHDTSVPAVADGPAGDISPQAATDTERTAASE